MRYIALVATIFLMCGFTTTYRNNPQTGKPDLVTNTVQASEVVGLTITGSNTGDVTLGTANGLSLSGQVLSLQAATNSVPGALTSADHTLLSTALQPGSNATSATTAGTVTTAAQPAITSVGTLTSLAVTGAITGSSFNSITGLASVAPLVNGTAAVGTSTLAARQDHVHGSDTTKANLASPTFTGTVTAPTFSGALSGNASTATALAANGTNCGAGQAPLGVDASGNAEGCFTPAGTYTLPTATNTVLGGVKPDGTSILNSSGVLSATAASVGAQAPLVSGTNIKTVNSNSLVGSGNVSVGTVTTASVATANGFAGTVATATSTPAITISTSVTGVLKGNGTAISAASAGTDYASPSQAMFIGTTSHAINRASATEALTGITSIDGSAATLTTSRTINGVSFNGSANIQTATANTSDYITGTFTPVWTGLTVVNGTGSVTYVGKYTAIGNMVFWNVAINVSGTATTASAGGTSTFFTGLPYAVNTIDVCTVALGTLATVGTGITHSNGNVYTPVWTALNSTVYLSGKYQK